LASGTTAPLGSVTVPLMPLSPWARRTDGKDKSVRQRTTKSGRRTLVKEETTLCKQTEEDFM
jgi:hypothetical protein